MKAPLLRNIVWWLPTLIVAGLIAIPMVSVLWSLTQPDDTGWNHIRETLLAEYLINTASLMLQVGGYTLVLGVGTAWLTAATRFPGSRVFSWALMLPMAAPAYIVAYVYTDLLSFSGPVQTLFREGLNLGPEIFEFPEIRSLPGAALVISIVLYPYVYLLTRVAFLQSSVTLFDAARTLGSSPGKAFFRIALPAARPAIVGGLSLVLMETLADFGVVDYFGVPTFATGIFRTWFASGEKLAATKLAAVLFLFVIALVVLEKSSRNSEEAPATGIDGKTRKLRLRGLNAVLAFSACALPVGLGCIIPLYRLCNFAWEVGDPLWGEQFIDFAFNTIQVALLAAIFAVVAALQLNTTRRLAATKATRLATGLATLGYALPGTMLAVGLLSPLSQVDRQLTEFSESYFGWSGGLILSGTIALLVYAYITRFLTVAYNATDSGMSQIPSSYYEAARTMGAAPFRVIAKIQLPLLRRSIVTALLLVFVDTMRELPATLLLRPFNFETLATRVYRLAGDERLAEASTAALCIVALGLLPVLLVTRQSRQ